MFFRVFVDRDPRRSCVMVMSQKDGANRRVTGVSLGGAVGPGAGPLNAGAALRRAGVEARAREPGTGLGP